MYRPLLLLLCFDLLLACAAQARQDVDYEGFAELASEWIDAGSATQGSRWFRAKIQLELELTRNIDLELDLRGSSLTENIELRAVEIDFDYTDAFRIRAGYLKKRFGLEELSARENLYTLERSQVNAFLSTIGFAGRDYSVQVFRRYEGEGPPYSFYTGLTVNESKTTGGFGRFSLHNRLGISQLGIGGVYQRFHVFEAEGVQHIFAFDADAALIRKETALEVELFFGKDPYETQIRRFTGESAPVYFTALRGLARRRFSIPSPVVPHLEPVVMSGYLLPDTRQTDRGRFQMLGGLNVYFDEDVRLIVNAVLLSSRGRFQPVRSTSGSSFSLTLQARW